MANRGEYAELYVLFHLLGTGKLFSADEKLNKNTDSFLEILTILREEVQKQVKTYNISTEESCVYIRDNDDKLISQISIDDFCKNAELLFQTIQEGKGKSFDLDYVTKTFMEKCSINKPKHPNITSGFVLSKYGVKSDIVIKIRDFSTSLTSIQGFSIKSSFHNPATLFNASYGSNFVYRIKNCDDNKMNTINKLNTTKGKKDKVKRAKYIKENHLDLELIGTKRIQNEELFFDNLVMIRPDLLNVLDECIKIHYFDRSKKCKICDICDKICKTNPLSVKHPEYYYPKVIKDFLYASFAGVTSTDVWNGLFTVNGGYIVVKKDGEVLVIHSGDTEVLRTFLFKNTKIDRPDASDDRCNYAFVYKENTDYFIDLNFQIRFIR